MTTIRPGSIGISTIDGHTGAFVKFGQRFMGATKEDAEWSHAFLVGLNDDVFQAMPNGMERGKLSDYLADMERGDKVLFINVPLTDQQRTDAVLFSEDLVARRIGYSYRTYLYLMLRRLGLRTAGIRRRIASEGYLICSQSVDVTLAHVGFHVFTDGRSYQDVIPADFHAALRTDPRFRVLDTKDAA